MDLMDMPQYFDAATVCLSCETRFKGENRLVCDWCHANELLPEWLLLLLEDDS